ncbi:MAG: DUF1552 domain-containing protein [Myxococcales bacterium]|nr:DUF1552 domain-containing protein [Myxococcales bacterium]
MADRTRPARRAPGLIRAPLSRRAFLRGTGLALSLPFFDAMRPAMSWAGGAAPVPPVRFIAFYVPCGIHMPAWWPATVGPDFEITPILEPAAPFRDRLLVLGGINNRPARPDGPGDHAAGTGSFLTAAHCFKTEGADIRNGQSIDQHIANAVGQGHRFPSLILGAEGGGNAGGCDSGYSCAYSRNISWVDENTPAAKETRPVSVFNRLFAGAGDGVDAETLRKKQLYRRSLLDFVLDDAQRLQAKLGATDRGKLDEYLTGVRELERQIDLAEAQACDAGLRPERADDFRDTVRQMIDLTALTVECDLSPVVTFMLGNGGSNRAYPFLGIPEGHHQLSHHQGNVENHVKLQAIDTWEMEQFAYLLGRLDAIDEGNGTALDNSVIFFSSEIEDGNSHSHFDLPILVAGRAGGRLQSGQYVRFPGGRADGPSMGNLFITLAGLCGAPAAAFGDDGLAPLALPV